MEASAIASTLAISQDGKRFEVNEPSGDMHIHEDGSNLTIYVPTSRKAQEFCFCSPLPAKLAGWLMRDPNTDIPEPIDNALVTSLTTLLNAGRSVVDRVLDHQGIVRVPISNEDQDSDEGILEPDLDSDTDSDAASHLGSDLDSDVESTSKPILDAITESEETDKSANEVVVLTQVTSSSTRSVSASLRNSAATRHVSRDVQSPPIEQHDLHHPPDETTYRKLLDKVLAAARANNFPSKGMFDMSRLSSSLPVGVDVTGFDGFESSELGFMSGPNAKVERDRKVGAAGELYVSCPSPEICLCLTYVCDERYLNSSLVSTPAFPDGVGRIGRVTSGDTPEHTLTILILEPGMGEKRQTSLTKTLMASSLPCLSTKGTSIATNGKGHDRSTISR